MEIKRTEWAKAIYATLAWLLVFVISGFLMVLYLAPEVSANLGLNELPEWQQSRWWFVVLCLGIIAAIVELCRRIWELVCMWKLKGD